MTGPRVDSADDSRSSYSGMSDFDDRTQASAPSAGPDEQERQWALIVHLAALAGFVIPFGNLIGPLVVWQIKKADMPFVDDQGKEAVNFQITVSIAVLVSVLLMVVLIGMLLLPVVVLGALVLTVIGAVKANTGERYRYPFAWRPLS